MCAHECYWLWNEEPTAIDTSAPTTWSIREHNDANDDYDDRPLMERFTLKVCSTLRKARLAIDKELAKDKTPENIRESMRIEHALNFWLNRFRVLYSRRLEEERLAYEEEESRRRQEALDSKTVQQIIEEIQDAACIYVSSHLHLCMGKGVRGYEELYREAKARETEKRQSRLYKALMRERMNL